MAPMLGAANMVRCFQGEALASCVLRSVSSCNHQFNLMCPNESWCRRHGALDMNVGLREQGHGGHLRVTCTVVLHQ